MATPPPVTDTLARFVTETDIGSMSDKTLRNAKLHILDTLGVALAGVATPVAEIALSYCKNLGASKMAASAVKPWLASSAASAPLRAELPA